MIPETKYARSGDLYIAYQVFGQGPNDLVVVPGFVTHVEHVWEEPSAERFFNRLGSFARVIMFDKRGTGLSDRVAEKDLPTLEQRSDDVRAVMDAVGSQSATLFCVSDGGPLCLLFAASFPQRTTGLILFGTYARRSWAPDYPWGTTPEEHERFLDSIRTGWGNAWAIDVRAPSLAHDERFRQWYAAEYRLGASPGAALALYHMNMELDVRHVLPAIRVPTLILRRAGDVVGGAGHSRYMAEHIAGARYVELAGVDHIPFVGDADRVAAQIEEFVTGARSAPEPDRVLATLLFTDIVGSTQLAAAIGDRRWRDLLVGHHRLLQREIAHFRGRVVDTTGDGYLAMFDGPARAIRCAQSICIAVRALGIEVRTGLHCGEIELLGTNIGGIAVHIAARVMATADAGEVLVSQTVKDLVAGSGIPFVERGSHGLKGVPGEWQLFAAVG